MISRLPASIQHSLLFVAPFVYALVANAQSPVMPSTHRAPSPVPAPSAADQYFWEGPAPDPCDEAPAQFTGEVVTTNFPIGQAPWFAAYNPGDNSVIVTKGNISNTGRVYKILLGEFPQEIDWANAAVSPLQTRGCAVGGGYIWVANSVGNIEKKNPATGTTIESIMTGTPGSLMRDVEYDATTQSMLLLIYSGSGSVPDRIVQYDALPPHDPINAQGITLNDPLQPITMGFGLTRRHTDDTYFITSGTNTIHEFHLLYDDNGVLVGYEPGESYASPKNNTRGAFWSPLDGDLHIIQNFIPSLNYINRITDGQCMTWPAGEGNPYLPLQGDMDGNGIVNMDDATIFMDALDAALYRGVSDPLADLNGDGSVSGRDIERFVDRLVEQDDR